MRSKARHASPFPLASVPMASWVAFLLAFLLATHAFWCGLGGGCNDEGTPGLTLVSMPLLSHPAAQTLVQSTVHHSHPLFDVCAGMDETRSILEVVTPSVVPALLIWVTLIFVSTATLLLTLSHRAEVFGRDGPVSVPPLRARFVRTSLPHRAPPVFLT